MNCLNMIPIKSWSLQAEGDTKHLDAETKARSLLQVLSVRRCLICMWRAIGLVKSYTTLHTR